MKKCNLCGFENPDYVTFCSQCGSQSFSAYAYQPGLPMYPPPAAPKKTNVGVIIAVVVIVIMLVIVLVFAIPYILRKEATVYGTICSTHALYTVSYSFYSDGRLIASGSLSPLDCETWEVSEWWVGSDSITVHYSAQSEGGGFGAQTDSETVTLYENSVEYITLYV